MALSTGRVLLVIASAAVAACGSSSPPSGTAPSTAVASVRTTPQLPSTGAVSTSAAPAGCILSASLGPPNSFAGHSVVMIILTNKGDAACALDGYPSVRLIGPGGIVASPVEAQGGGQAAVATPSSVSVAPGGRASFVVEFTDVPSGSAACPKVTELTIDLPSSAGSVSQVLAGALQPCPPTFRVGAITGGP